MTCPNYVGFGLGVVVKSLYLFTQGDLACDPPGTVNAIRRQLSCIDRPLHFSINNRYGHVQGSYRVGDVDKSSLARRGVQFA